MTTDRKAPAPPPTSKMMVGIFNAFFTFILRSPLHNMLSKSFIILSFTGRKSGKQYNFVVGYQRKGDELHIISPRGWWKNMQAGNFPVTVLLKGQKHQGLAEGFHGNEKVVQIFSKFVQQTPALIKMYGMERDANGLAKPESVRQAASHIAIVSVQLTSTR